MPMLESMRRRLRGLVQFIDKRQRKPVYTDFEDLIGEETPVLLPGFSVVTNEASSDPRRRRSCASISTMSPLPSSTGTSR